MSAKKPTEPTLAILWGTKTRSMSWVHLYDSGLKDFVGNASPDGFWLRATTDPDVAWDVYVFWQLIQTGTRDEQCATHATHRIDAITYPPHITPIEALL